jgi:hypothetical protein
MLPAATENCAVTKNTPSLTWRNILPTHPAAKEFVAPTPTDLKKLADDIAANGLQNKVKLQWRDGVRILLDGRSRLDALEMNGRTIDLDDTSIFEVVAESVDPVAYVIGANILRRHLTDKQRQNLLIKLIARTPEKSDRRIGKEIGVDHKTIAKARARGRDVGTVPHVGTRIDSKGRRQPATRVRKSTTKVEASPSPAALTAPPGSRAAPVLPAPVAPIMAGNGLDPGASAAARKAFYAATEPPPVDVTTNYAANRRGVSGERHPALTSALRKAVLAMESDNPAAEIIRTFKEFVTLAVTLGIRVDCIDVCARRALQ